MVSVLVKVVAGYKKVQFTKETEKSSLTNKLTSTLGEYYSVIMQKKRCSCQTVMMSVSIF